MQLTVNMPRYKKFESKNRNAIKTVTNFAYLRCYPRMLKKASFFEG